jgi:hypothetical protein
MNKTEDMALMREKVPVRVKVVVRKKAPVREKAPAPMREKPMALVELQILQSPVR